MAIKFKDYVLYIGLSRTARKWYFSYNGLKHYEEAKQHLTQTGFNYSILRINLFWGRFLISLSKRLPINMGV